MLCVSFLAAASVVMGALPLNTEFQYSGQLETQNRTPGTDVAKKTFTLHVISPTPDQLLFLVDERGGGGWEWHQRLGSYNLSTRNEPAIRLLQSVDGTPSPVVIEPPAFLFADRLATEMEWKVGTAHYEVTGRKKRENREVIVVTSTLDRGRHQTMEIDAASGLLVHLQERLFLGRGEAYELSMQLSGERVLQAEELANLGKMVETFTTLKKALPHLNGEYRADLPDEQLPAAQEAISALALSSDSAWGRYVTTVQRELSSQGRRAEGMVGLSQKLTGQKAPLTGTWKGLDGRDFAASDLAGHTTVLHFWEYNGDKLLEPYGQVGYLDFLYNRRSPLGVRVVGVAVDSRLSEPAQSRAAIRSVKKLQEFMNLGFPIVLDSGELLSQFGDPRTVGAPLPLWVVVGHDGTIVQHTSGFFNLKPDEGLRVLDQAVVDALKKEKAAAKK